MVKDHVISPDIVVVLVLKSFSHSCFNANVLKDYVGIYFNTWDCVCNLSLCVCVHVCVCSTNRYFNDVYTFVCAQATKTTRNLCASLCIAIDNDMSRALMYICMHVVVSQRIERYFGTAATNLLCYVEEKEENWLGNFFHLFDSFRFGYVKSSSFQSSC